MLCLWQSSPCFLGRRGRLKGRREVAQNTVDGFATWQGYLGGGVAKVFSLSLGGGVLIALAIRNSLTFPAIDDLRETWKANFSGVDGNL